MREMNTIFTKIATILFAGLCGSLYLVLNSVLKSTFADNIWLLINILYIIGVFLSAVPLIKCSYKTGTIVQDRKQPGITTK